MPDELNGVFVIDKPSGITSFQVVKKVKHLTMAGKVGHTGTLDPLATGVLPLCLGRSTKLSDLIMKGDKIYKGVMRLGASTDTYDSEGSVAEQREIPNDLDIQDIREMAKMFNGCIMQSPPPFSAAKLGGKPLYKLARKGILVHKEPREVKVFAFEISDYKRPDVFFSIHCGKGTYVRSIVHELGNLLGCKAYLSSLRRVKSGPFVIDDAIPLAKFEVMFGKGATDHWPLTTGHCFISHENLMKIINKP
jgi:tRNA pseudouridine55 synthase